LDEALHHYDHAIKIDQGSNSNDKIGNYYYNRAMVKSKLERYEEALEDFKKALDQLTDTNPVFYVSFPLNKIKATYNKGICLRKLGRLDESIEHLKKAVEQKQDKASAHNNLGLSYFEKEEFQEALAEFTKAIQCEDHPFHLNNRGLAYYHIGSLDEAKKDFDEAIKKNDTDPFFYFNRGNVFLDQK
jgi:tetratricopeptide (TPR) repeat protein